MPLRVLIVDDSPVMRGFVRRVLDISGLDVATIFEAGDGAEGLELLSQQRIDLILTDINMPNMNGEEFVTKLAELALLPPPVVIVISTDATPLRIDHLRALGARGYLAKPFLPEALRAEVETVLGVDHAA